MKILKEPSGLKLLALSGVLIAVLSLGACGSSTKPGPNANNNTDQGFVADMLPHHMSAVTMARIALRRAQHPQIHQLATSIITAQNSEIALMNGIERRFGPDAAHSTLGLNMADMGMAMSPDALRNARPFDRAFMEMMIPHHRGAIAMARLELKSGTNPTSRALAGRIIDAQTMEISEMSGWLKQWYGVSASTTNSATSGMKMGG